MEGSHISPKEKRIANELRRLKKEKLEFIQAFQDETNRYIFYFLFVGCDDSDYKNGYYIGKIILSPDYPEKPGDFMILTPNGRFEINRKLCLSNSGYHSDQWTPTWTITNMLIGLFSIFNGEDIVNGRKQHSLGHLYDSPAVRKIYAKDSIMYNLSHYKNIFINFDQFIDQNGNIIQKLQESEPCDQKDINDKKTLSVQENDDKKTLSVQENDDKKDIDIFENIINNKLEYYDIDTYKNYFTSLRVGELILCIKNIKSMNYENFDMAPFLKIDSLINIDTT